MARTNLDDELASLLVETNDQRRRVGQAIYHFYRSLLFWRERGRTFHDIAKAWAPGGAAIFRTMSATLRRLEPHARDEPLRRYVAEVLDACAGDLERGDHMLIPFLRWIEGRFPALTDMMRGEAAESRVYDFEFARALQDLFESLAIADREAFVGRLRASARDIVARS